MQKHPRADSATIHPHSLHTGASMALRDKLAQRATPFLEPGEQIQSVFLAQSGASPYWSFLSAWIVIITAGYATVVVTDRAIVVLRNGRLTGSVAKSLLA